MLLGRRSAFGNLSQYDILWSACFDGKETALGRLDVDCAPGESRRIAAPHLACGGPDGVLYVRVLLKEDCAWAGRGHEIAAFCFALTQPERLEQPAAPAPKLSETAAAFIVSGEGFSYEFRKDEGVLSQMTVREKAHLSGPMRLNCFRAPTDNDDTFIPFSNIAGQWRRSFLFGDIGCAQTAMRNLSCAVHDDAAIVRSTGNFSFCATRYDLLEMAGAPHRKDLKPMAGSHLYVDYRMSGVGSASCGGQQPVTSCRINPAESVEFAVKLRPVL